MKRIITDYIEECATVFPDKIAYSDDCHSITFSTLRTEARYIATQLIARQYRRQPVAIYLDKGVQCISAFAGTICSGNFYSPIDTQMPIERIHKIFQKLNPVAIITDHAHLSSAEQFAGPAAILCFEDLIQTAVDDSAVLAVESQILDSDILYVLFTSGSTGMPKGVVLTHHSVIDFATWAVNEFHFDHETIFGNQTPLYFSMSVYDVYIPLFTGACTHIIPSKLFSFPVKLTEYLQAKSVNTLVWVPSALSFISILNAVGKPHLDTLQKILFGGEVMPVKHLNKWIQEYPNVTFVNIYGPTEVTDTCTFYTVDHIFSETESLPIGVSCRNKDTFLLDECDRLISPDDVETCGEICVRGSGIAVGYYMDPEKTRSVFVQNPLNSTFPEIIYRTGDLGKYNEYKELLYVSRKDFQIKHKGHRIELGEIETAALSLESLQEACCLYDEQQHRIVLYYVGEIPDHSLATSLKNLLPQYMLPAKRISLEQMPKNQNGKIDRQYLKSIL